MFWLKRAIQIFFSLWHYFWWNITFHAFIKNVKVILSWYLPKIGTLRAETPNPPWKRWKCSIMKISMNLTIFSFQKHINERKLNYLSKHGVIFPIFVLFFRFFWGGPFNPTKKNCVIFYMFGKFTIKIFLSM